MDAVFTDEQNNSKKSEQENEIYEKNLKLVTKFFENFEKLGIYLKNSIGDSETYVFGANSGTQLLLKKYLKNSKIIGILDNSSLKSGKLLYGFNYVVNKPEILTDIENIEEKKLIICTGKYVQEIKKQIKKINDKIQIITNENF